ESASSRHRPNRRLAPASRALRSIVRPSEHRLIASCVIYILPVATHVKNAPASLPAVYFALKLEVIFCVQGVFYPILANLFLHYAFVLWMKRTHPDLLWCRYADDGLVHCRTEQEAEALKVELQARLGECQLQMHPTKTRIVYCKDD